MKNIEAELINKKIQIDEIEVPEELEDRLRKALNNPQKFSKEGTKRKCWIMRHKWIAAGIGFFMFIGLYNLDALAHYGRKIMGYDEIASQSLKEINEQGGVQEVNNSYTYKNGIQLVLDGVILDENKLEVMYRLIGDEDKIYEMNTTPPTIKTELGSCNPVSGVASKTEDGKGLSIIKDYESPSIKAKTLTFALASKDGEEAKFTFEIDSIKVIGNTIKSTLSETVEFDGIKYNFTDLCASPLSVVIKSKVEVTSEGDKNLFILNPFAPNSVRRELKVELIEIYEKDGKEVTENLEIQGWEEEVIDDEVFFNYEFSGLKPNVKKLLLRAVKTDDIKRLDKEIKINKNISNLRLVADTEELIIKEVREENGDTVVVLQSEKDVVFDPILYKGIDIVEELSKESEIVTVNGQEVLQVTYKYKGYSEDRHLSFTELRHERYINKDIVIYEKK